MADHREYAESAQFLRSVLDSINDPIKVIDRGRRIFYVNKAAEEFAGATLAEIFCERCHERFQGRPEPCEHCLAEATFEHGRPLRTMVRLDEGPRKGYFEIFTYPLGDRPEFMIELVRDITERRRLEDELLKADRLASVGEVAAAVAHEIRNPLGAIITALDLLRVQPEQPPDEEDMSLLAAVKKEARRLNQIVTDFLRYARPPTPKLEPVDLRALVSDTVTALRNSEKLQGQVHFGVELPADLPPVLADPNQMRQVLWNIGRNALEAMPEGGSLRFVGRVSEGQVELAVADTGTGIIADDMEKVFAPFYTSREEGTGLGLSIARRILEAHGGSIRAETERAAGSVFILTIPAAPLVPRSGERLLPHGTHSGG